MREPIFTTELVDLTSKGLKFLKQAAIRRFVTGDGEERQYESLVGAKPTVLVAPLTPEGKLVLINLFRFGVEDYVFELPGGVKEVDESNLEAAKREFLEETGYKITGELSLLASCWLFNSKSDAFAEIWLARDCVKRQRPSLDPVEEVAGLTVVEMDPRKIVSRIDRGFINIDPPVSHALLALQARGLIKL